MAQEKDEFSEIKGIIKESVPYYQQDPLMFLKFMLEADSLLNELRHIDKTEFYKLKGKVKNNLGVYHWKTEKLNQGLQYLDSSLYFRKMVNDIDGSVQSLVNIALIHNDLGDVYKAEKTYNDALKYLDKNPDSILRIDVYNNLGVLFCNQDLYPKGHQFFLKAYQLMDKSSTNSKGTILNNIGSTLMEMDSLDASIDYFRKAFSIFEELDNRNGLASALMNFGRVSERSGEFQDAISYYEEAIQFYIETENSSGLILAYNEMSAALLNLGEKQKAMTYSLKAESLLSESDKMLTKKNVYENLYEAHKSLGNKSLALDYYEKFNALTDSIQNENFVREALYKESQMRFKMEKDSIAQIHEREQIMAEGRSRLERQIYLFTIIVISIVLIFLIVLIKNYRSRQKLIKQNYVQEQLLNRQLESSLIEKSKQLTKESFKNLKSQKVIDEIDGIIKQSDEMNADEINQNMRSIKSEIVENKLTQKRLDSHSIFLEGENEEFSLRLKNLFPKLTPGDLKMCVLLRNNHTAHEICMILSISPNTFRSSKYRIRRRMELEKGTRLQDYLFEV